MSTGQTLLGMAGSARVHSLHGPSQGDQNDLGDIHRKSKMTNCGHGRSNSVQEAMKWLDLGKAARPMPGCHSPLCDPEPEVRWRGQDPHLLALKHLEPQK